MDERTRYRVRRKLFLPIFTKVIMEKEVVEKIRNRENARGDENVEVEHAKVLNTHGRSRRVEIVNPLLVEHQQSEGDRY